MKMENLIVKFLLKEANREELDQLAEWVKKPENEKLFFEYIETNALIELNMSVYDTKVARKKILRQIKRRKNVFINRRISNFLKYAAVAIIFLGIGYFYQNIFLSDEPTLIAPNNSITLQLDNGNVKIISENGSTEVVNTEGKVVGIQKGNQLVYDNEDVVETLHYNTITVPYGKQFDLVLSDGSEIKLNSGTSLKYPINFIKGENRQVFLNGEAFFKVAEDKDHPFIVNADELSIRVLGTSFNVSSYPEDSNVDAVLVKGAVSVYQNDRSYDEKNASRLEPGYKASLNKIDKNVSIEQVELYLYTAWVDGKIIFKHLPFKNIIKKLERHYDVIIENNNEELAEELFSASFDIENIQQVFQTLNKAYPIDYHLNENKIIIN